MSKWENRFYAQKIPAKVFLVCWVFGALIRMVGTWLGFWSKAATGEYFIWCGGLALVVLDFAVIEWAGAALQAMEDIQRELVSGAVKELQDSMKDVQEAVEQVEKKLDEIDQQVSTLR